MMIEKIVNVVSRSEKKRVIFSVDQFLQVIQEQLVDHRRANTGI